MTRVSFFLTVLYLLRVPAFFSQDYHSYGNSNYSGVTQLISNPASGAASKLKLDVLVGGFDVIFNNSWAAVKREAISFPVLPGSWKNYTPNFEGNIYKNFEWQGKSNSKEVLFEQRILLPSVLVRLNSKNSVAFSCSMRQIGNISGISPQLANLFENEFVLGVLRNNPVQNTNFQAIRMSWLEYGFIYARMLVDKGPHRLKAGITPKLLQGLESSYFLLRNLNFLFSNKDTNSYFDADFTVAHSARTGSPLDIMADPSAKLQHAAPMSFGLDFGLMYEWHPAVPKSEAPPLEKSNGEKANTYKIKAGLSIVDLGKIRFKKEMNYYDMQFSLRQNDIIRYISAENMRMIDSLLQHDFPANTGDDNFAVLTPAALNVQVDYSFNQRFFLNLSSHITGFYKSNFFKVRNYSSVCLAPRFESYWVDVSLLLIWNALSASRSKPLTPGINLRFGPLSIGSSDLSFLYKTNLSSLDLYAMLRVSIPYKNKTEKAPEKKRNRS
jgi:hypothetical protein